MIVSRPKMLLDASSGGAGSTALTLFLVAIYFIPTIVAIVGRHRRWLLVGLVNLLFGWTVIGWFIALGLLATRSRSQPTSALPTTPPVPTAPPPATQPSRTDQLERLVALRDRGALTEEEFAAEKAKLLGNP